MLAEATGRGTPLEPAPMGQSKVTTGGLEGVEEGAEADELDELVSVVPELAPAEPALPVLLAEFVGALAPEGVLPLKFV